MTAHIFSSIDCQSSIATGLWMFASMKLRALRSLLELWQWRG